MTEAPFGRDRYALNVSLVLAGLPVAERPAAAAAAGFGRIEMWWPFATPAPTSDEIGAVRDALSRAGVHLVCVNIDGGDHGAGERGLLADPGRRARCERSVLAVLRLAADTGCRLVNLPYGNRDPRVPVALQHRTAYENLLFAAGKAAAEGVTVLLEPLNSTDNPGYLLPDADGAARVLERAREAGAGNVGMLLDVYHVARAGQDPALTIARHAPLIRHVQFADTPGRSCPGNGDIDFARVRRTLLTAGYEGSVGLEFSPVPDTATALRAARRFVGAPTARRAGHRPDRT
ncbi:TIM barrel protein [Streptomyces sp. NPDC094034]|uniref:hydroxypyruvate isomerase family protein n=1 Tax=Streptomyces sp. NPDC094034 TaxID=3155309 RepID=UPI00332FC630